MKTEKQITMKNNIDFYNFCTADTRLPILEILNERFTRSFRVSFSNYIRMISTIKYEVESMTMKEWQERSRQMNYMNVVRLNTLKAPMVIRFDRELSYGVLNIITGQEKRKYDEEETKEFTQIELTLLKNISDMILADLNDAWAPVHNIGASYIRAEINSGFIGIVPPTEKVKVVKFDIEFADRKGILEFVFPYSSLFPVRNKLYIQN